LKIKLPEGATREEAEKLFAELVVEEGWEKVVDLFMFWQSHVLMFLMNRVGPSHPTGNK
jgi:hypothetical protein